MAGDKSSAKSSSPKALKYYLSRELVGHADEVIGLAVFNDGNIVSASKDGTARLWKRSHGEYSHSVVMTGHQDGVCSVCVIEPTEENPTGFIVTGSYDSHICVYHPGGTEPLYSTHAHKEEVTCLKASRFQPDYFLSSSMDSTGKLWNVLNVKKAKAVFTGHLHGSAVYCICDLSNGLIVSGASDNAVLIHKRCGTLMHKLTGHTRSVTDIAVIGNNTFLTCSHDKMVLLWDALQGSYMQKYDGHIAHINSIAVTDGGKLAISCGKDHRLKIWREGVSTEALLIPVDSIWNVEFLFNEDIVCTASDCLIRIFSTDLSKLADEETLYNYMRKVDELVKTLRRHDLIAGVVYKNNIPEDQAINKPGKKDGEIVTLKKNNNKTKICKWSEEDSKWLYLGEVEEANSEKPKKPLVNGVEYDYVFYINISEDRPLFKLPYNKGEDLRAAANQFLKTNDIPSTYLQTVIDFVKIGTELKPEVNCEVKDDNCTSSDDEDIIVTIVPQLFIPQQTCLQVDQGSVAAIIEKLIEYNEKVPKSTESDYETDESDKSDSVTSETLKSLTALFDPDISNARIREINLLLSLYTWPDKLMYPVLDMSRMALTEERVNDVFCEKGIWDPLKRYLLMDSLPKNQALAFNILANICSHITGQGYCIAIKYEIFGVISKIAKFKSKHVETAVATFVLNFVVTLTKSFDLIGREEILQVILEYFNFLTDDEAIFRTLIAIGTLINESKESDVREKLKKSVKTSRPIISALLRYMDASGSPLKTPLQIYYVSKEIVRLIR